MAKLIFGCGYLGLRVARLWRAAGEEVFAVTRSAEKAASLAAEGVQPIVADLLEGPKIQVPQGVETAVFAVGYERGSPRSVFDVYVTGVINALAWLPDALLRFIYISSTGVYGHFAGSEVDEDSPCEPMREGGKACLAAERAIEVSAFASRAIILRLAGLYGPGRIPRAGDLIAGRPIDAPAEGWLNLIHVDDAARMVLLAEKNVKPPRTYVVSDGHPAQRGEYYAELARLLGAPPPKFVAAPDGSPAAQRAASDKRVNPRRMQEELKPELRYPDYRAGLTAIVAEENGARKRLAGS